MGREKIYIFREALCFRWVKMDNLKVNENGVFMESVSGTESVGVIGAKMSAVRDFCIDVMVAYL